MLTVEKPKRRSKLSRNHRPEDMTLEEWQIALRREFGQAQDFRMENVGGHRFFSDFEVTNPQSRRTYRVTVRGEAPGRNSCTCPDFAVNTLGTCKHIEFVLARLREKRGAKAAFKRGFAPESSEVWLASGSRRRVIFTPGTTAPEGLRELASCYFDGEGSLKAEAEATFPAFLKAAEALGHEVRCQAEALDLLAELRDARRRRAGLDARYPEASAVPDDLLRTRLYPYQREGALFAARAGRALLGDEMGLGKTIQAMAWAELLARESGIERVLVICPSSLKYQWHSEIERFTGREATVVEGMTPARRARYAQGTFYTIVNYDVVHRDLEAIARLAPDAIILDEAQRIKNWRTRAAQAVKSLASPFALVLTGTPLENRLEELHSLVEFVDRHRLGPLFRFLDSHQVTEGEGGRVTGYRNLQSLGETLEPILVRRRKAEVLTQLPERTDKNYFVPMTPEQRALHEENGAIVAQLAARWRRNKFLTEADQRRLTIALQRMRMACDEARLVDPEKSGGPKIPELMALLGEVLEEPGAKVVVFSQWSKMQDLVARELEERGLPYEYLHGGVPAPERRNLVERFRQPDGSRIFLSTDAGGVGLNLQAASTVVNLDLPWNPAVLEQRIARVHRLGQQRNVRVANFVAEGTIEHGMLSVLRFKKGLFEGVLDGGADEIYMDGTRLQKFMESVEAVSASVPATPPAEETGLAASPGEETAPAAPAPDLAPLLSAGATLLQELGTFLQAQKQPGRSLAESLTEVDPSTGRAWLKVPMPDPATVQTLLQAAGPLLELLGKA